MAGLRIALIEPFYTGSHKYWVDRLKHYLNADVHLFTLTGRHWKWRMSSAAIPLADVMNESKRPFDVILTTDMLDVANFRAMLGKQHTSTPIVLYMHENQVVYPFQTSENDKDWDRHYGLINYKSMLVADEVWFNSAFHKSSLLHGLVGFLKPFPESKYYQSKLKSIESQSSIVPLGIDVKDIEKHRTEKSNKHCILWNHRWEHDKNPNTFFELLNELSIQGVDFDLIVCGEQFTKSPKIFNEARKNLDKHIVHWGYFDSREDYLKALWRSTLLPVTNNQEFFGLSVMEAVHAEVIPILPKRLTYPELYHESAYFYEHDVGLKQLLLDQLSKPYSFDKQLVNRNYCWSFVADEYLNKLAKYAT